MYFPKFALGKKWWGVINAIGTANQRVGKEKDDCR